MNAAPPPPRNNHPHSIAIIGGGITGAIAAHTLSKYDNLSIHVFDQGRRGVGGRSSSRSAVVDNDDNSHDNTATDQRTLAPANSGNTTMRWDHGCQFFRADTPKFHSMVHEWIQKGIVKEWNGNFAASPGLHVDHEFFGLPSKPPFYVGTNGMQSLVRGVLDDVQKELSERSSMASDSSTSTSLRIFTGTRVAHLDRVTEDDATSNNKKKWKLYGTSGMAAYHDTPEKIAQSTNEPQLLGNKAGYDAILLTDVSTSTFGKWHRASASVPQEFAVRVSKRVGARVPLFSAMVAFRQKTNIPFDAASLDDEIVWFAARSNSKPGMLMKGGDSGENQEEKGGSSDGLARECWTIISTPQYAMNKIEETPMQHPITGEFIPQSPDYLTTVPGPELYNAFQALICSKEDGILDEEHALDSLPEVVYMDAQRWGSALPCHCHLKKEESTTRKVLSGVAYDSERFALAPTKRESKDHDSNKGDVEDQLSFLVDENLMLFQAGDMVSMYTPGLEGAALSGCDAAEYLHDLLLHRGSATEV